MAENFGNFLIQKTTVGESIFIPNGLNGTNIQPISSSIVSGNNTRTINSILQVHSLYVCQNDVNRNNLYKRSETGEPYDMADYYKYMDMMINDSRFPSNNIYICQNVPLAPGSSFYIEKNITLTPTQSIILDFSNSKVENRTNLNINGIASFIEIIE